VLVLLAELGYLRVFLGGSVTVALGGGNNPIPTFTVANRPELGQLLSTARQYILLHQFLPVLVPAVAVALAAFAFELIGVALRTRQEPVTMMA
jgi:ABC-type dipeptide/oligopeptide/nickel transport system permease subunit